MDKLMRNIPICFLHFFEETNSEIMSKLVMTMIAASPRRNGFIVVEIGVSKSQVVSKVSVTIEPFNPTVGLLLPLPVTVFAGSCTISVLNDSDLL